VCSHSVRHQRGAVSCLPRGSESEVSSSDAHCSQSRMIMLFILTLTVTVEIGEEHQQKKKVETSTDIHICICHSCTHPEQRASRESKQKSKLAVAREWKGKTAIRVIKSHAPLTRCAQSHSSWVKWTFVKVLIVVLCDQLHSMDECCVVPRRSEFIGQFGLFGTFSLRFEEGSTSYCDQIPMVMHVGA